MLPIIRQHVQLTGSNGRATFSYNNDIQAIMNVLLSAKERC
jgi:hypothetical protein